MALIYHFTYFFNDKKIRHFLVLLYKNNLENSLAPEIFKTLKKYFCIAIIEIYFIFKTITALLKLVIFFKCKY